MTEYKSWPLGQLPPEFRRPELDQLKKNGYKFNDPREVVTIFENKVAKFAGAEYGVAVDCCTHGLFLSLLFYSCLLYTSPSPRDRQKSRMPSSA